MYHDLRGVFWLDGLKKDITDVVAKCPICQQVKVEHLKLSGLLQEIQIPTWKWEDTNIHFIVGLLKTRTQHESIRVDVDRFTKSAQFIPVKSTYSAEDYVKIYIDHIVRLHGIILSIIFDRVSQFTSRFWRTFKKGGVQVSYRNSGIRMQPASLTTPRSQTSLKSSFITAI